jgi:hypothetical protein
MRAVEQSDSALLENWVTRRDAEAITAIVARHSRMVFATCRRILGNPSDAEDVAQERRLRSRLVQLLSGHGVPRGTLSARERTCGKSGCRCARGEKHGGLYLVFSEEGRLRQVFVSRTQERRVRLWVAQYREIRELLETLARLHLERLRKEDPSGDA